jgi:hypothetical protein
VELASMTSRLAGDSGDLWATFAQVIVGVLLALAFSEVAAVRSAAQRAIAAREAQLRGVRTRLARARVDLASVGASLERKVQLNGQVQKLEARQDAMEAELAEERDALDDTGSTHRRLLGSICVAVVGLLAALAMMLPYAPVFWWAPYLALAAAVAGLLGPLCGLVLTLTGR